MSTRHCGDVANVDRAHARVANWRDEVPFVRDHRMERQETLEVEIRTHSGIPSCKHCYAPGFEIDDEQQPTDLAARYSAVSWLTRSIASWRLT